MLVVSCTVEPAPPDPITLTFTFPQSQDRARYQAIATHFQERYPHISLHLRPDPTGEWTRDPQNAADAFIWWPDLSLLEPNPRILNLGSLLDQTPDLTQGDWYTRAADACRLGNAQWTLPAEIDMQMLYYNRDLFDQYAAPYPHTGWMWDDLLTTATALTLTPQGSGARKQYGLVLHPAWGDFVPFIYQNDGDLFAPGDPQTIEALRWFTDLTRVHGVVPPMSQLADGDTYGFFGKARAAMWIGFLGDRDGMGFHHLGTPWSFNWGVVPLPGNKTEATLYRAQCYYITAHSEHVDAAWTWLQFLSTHPTGRGLPARRATAQSAEFRTLVGDEVAASALYAVERLIPRPEPEIAPPKTLETYARTVESLVNDGERYGFYAPPVLPERFESCIIGILNDQYTVDEAIAILRVEAGTEE